MTTETTTQATEENTAPKFNLTEFFAERVAYTDESGVFNDTVKMYGDAYSDEAIIQVSEQFNPAEEFDEHIMSVGTFMVKAGQEIRSEPGKPDDKVCIARAKLLLEETLETIAGLGVCITIKSDSGPHLNKEAKLDYVADAPFNIVEVMDGVADIRVIATGTALACGFIPCATLQREVDINNLAKFRTDKDGYRNEAGKWVKPSDHPIARVELAYNAVVKGMNAFTEFLAERRVIEARMAELTAVMEDKKSQGLPITAELEEAFKLQGLELPQGNPLDGLDLVGQLSEADLAEVRTAECRPEDLEVLKESVTAMFTEVPEGTNVPVEPGTGAMCEATPVEPEPQVQPSVEPDYNN